MIEPSFRYETRGESAGINSIRFYSCTDCGACVVVMHNNTDSLDAHRDWHARLTVGEVGA